MVVWVVDVVVEEVVIVLEVWWCGWWPRLLRK